MARMSIIGIPPFETLWTDVRQVLRQFQKKPAFAGTVILVLAAGFGVSIAMFSTIRNVLLNRLPYKAPDRLVQIVSRWPKTGEQTGWSAPFRDALDWKTTVPAFQDVAMYRYMLLNLTEAGGQAEALYGLRTTSNLLPLLGIHPQLGQWFSAGDDQPGHTHVMILSDDLWRRRFHADPQIIGKIIHLDSEGYQVLGVMPKGFNFPLKLGTGAQLPTDQMQYWIPLGADLSKEQRGDPNAGVIARLNKGIPIAEASAQLETSCQLLQSRYPVTNKDMSAVPLSLRQQTVGQFNAPLLALLAATGLILVLTCTNIASLLLAKGELSSHELAVRMALGGTIGRVARIPLVEGIMLCFAGCLLGVPLAVVILKLLIYLAPIDIPRLAATRIDLQAVFFGLFLALLCGFVVGGLNALQVLRRSPREVLSEGSRGSSGRPPATLRSGLVIGQIAFAVILVSGAGLMLRTFVNLLSTDIGYKPDHVLYSVTVLPPSQYSKRADMELFYKKVLDRLRTVPEIESAAASTGFPMVGQYDSAKAQPAGLENGDRSSGVSTDFDEVSPGYLEAMGVRLKNGRTFTEADTANTPKVAVIDTDLAKRLWPDQDPLGKLINTDDPAKPVWRQIVGVVAPTRNRSLDIAARPSVYVPLSQGAGWVNFVIVKSLTAPEETTRLLKSIVSSVDPNQSVFFAQSMSQLIQDSIATRRLLFIALAFFGFAALILAALGIYGLVSFIAASRAREVGIRMALGAKRGNIAALVLFQGIRLALLGITAGLIGSTLLSRLLTGLLFGVRPYDFETLLFAILTLGAVTTIAAFVPAYRSARLEPMRALRTE
jgi:putative ABC transport system permease protein